MPKTRTRLIVAVGIVAFTLPIVAFTLPIVLQYQENQRLQQELAAMRASQSSMVDQQSSVVSSLTRADRHQSNEGNSEEPKSRQRSNRSAPSQGEGSTVIPAGGESLEKEPFIRVKRASLEALHFKALGDDLALTQEATDLLELTPGESSRLSEILAELQRKVQAHDLSHLRALNPSEVGDADLSRFLQTMEGQKTAYGIPPFSDAERMNVQQWFEQSVYELLGEDRQKLFAKNSRQAIDYWLGDVQDKFLAFVDRYDAQGALEHHWMIKFKTSSSEGTVSGSGSSAVPRQLAYLFEVH